MNREKLQSFSQGWIEHSFKALVDRNLRELRRAERQLADQRTTKHQLQARNSCIADAQSYRVARRLRLLTKAQFD